jgi:tetratricopeptide (TPR) repeat protein
VLAGQRDELSAQQRAAWQSAADEYLATLQYTADRPEARVALGSFEARLGRHEQAQAAFAQALALDPDFLPAYLNAADDWRAQGNEAQARAALESGLARDPKNAALRHALGLALVRAGDRSKALQELDRAAQLAPNEPRYTYVYAIALNSTGRPADAIKLLARATARGPVNRDMLMALATMQRDAGDTDAARRTAAKLVQEFPSDPEANALASQMR